MAHTACRTRTIRTPAKGNRATTASSHFIGTDQGVKAVLPSRRVGRRAGTFAITLERACCACPLLLTDVSHGSARAELHPSGAAVEPFSASGECAHPRAGALLRHQAFRDPPTAYPPHGGR